ncbi:MAG: hypothetical protein GZ091_13225 [Paludibacter sp.]|nr:hypothetical protein [Paludibacter sp.]
MKWKKKGLIYGPEGLNGWDNNSFLAPLPMLVNEDVIRVYGTVRDAQGVGRPSYVELDAHNPSKVLYVNDKPLVEVGSAGAFDDNGVVVTGLLVDGNEVRLYYAGYSLSAKVRHLDFTGLIISHDGGVTFKKHQTTPILDRIPGEELTRAIQFVLKQDDKYIAYYIGGARFVQGEKKTIPEYDIRYLESEDGIHFPPIKGEIVVPVADGFVRVGKPFIVKENGIYKMFYADGGDEIVYQMAYAESIDGFKWEKKSLNFEFSDSGWDSQMQGYPAFLRVKDKAYMFYNGNSYGFDGFGYAELIEE